MTIDWWTLGLQTINVAILVFLLGRFFWHPVAAMIAERRAVALASLEAAEAKSAEAKAAFAEIERNRAGLAQERDQILASAREAAERLRAERLHDAEREAAALREAAQVMLDKERRSAEAAFAERAGRLAVTIAQKLLARLEGPTIEAAFLDALLGELRTLPATSREALARKDVTLEAVTATPLPPAEEERCREMIGAALAARPRIVFRAEAALIAGLELRAPHLEIANSWRADLDHILADLPHDHER